MASGPITSWQIDGETVEIVWDFIFWDSKVTADGDCSHKIKRRLLLGRKGMTNLDSIFKSRDITWPTKVHLAKAMVFPVVMYGCESWTKRKLSAEELMLWTVMLEKTLMLRKIEGRRRRGWQRMRWLNGITGLMDMRVADGQGGMACCSPWGRKESDTTERLNW